jgi:hypothetical protein
VHQLRLHTNSAVSGLIIVGLGAVFLCYQGTAGLTGLLSPPGLDGWDNRLQGAVTAVQAHVPDLALIAAAAAAVAVAVAAVTGWRLRRTRRPGTPDAPAGNSRARPSRPQEALAEDTKK